MNIVELIKNKRDGKFFTPDEISFLIKQFTKSAIPDYQFSALLMAILLKGMNDSESAAMTNSMLNSGKVIDLSSFKGRKIDEHSTGGVGDKTIKENVHKAYCSEEYFTLLKTLIDLPQVIFMFNCNF